MVNYPRTEQAFKAANYKYEKDGTHQEEERWYAKVKNPTTGNYIQYADLAAEYRTDESKANKVYPIVQVIQLIRVKTPDDKEWVKSRQSWTGLDQLGNEVEITFTDPEVWDKPVFIREMKKDPRNPGSPPQAMLTGYEFEQEYTRPFTKENVKELYSKANPNAVSLVIKKVDTLGQTAGHPYSIEKYQDFVRKPFEDLWEYMSTPRYKLDRSYGDNLQDNHIK